MIEAKKEQRLYAVRARFDSEWKRYAEEHKWSPSFAAAMLLELRKRERDKKSIRMREEMAVRLRNPNCGAVALSFPEIAPLLGYRSHGSVIAAVRRTSADGVTA